MAPQRRIGLTGGIATGKSAVARCLSEGHGIPVLDADQFAREALAPGTEATRAVLQRYGEAIRRTAQPMGEPADLDRAALARIVFADRAERQWLEDLVHPLVRHRLKEALAPLQAAPVVVLMIPLLFEAGLEALCTEIWVVDCGETAEQLRRLMARDGLSLEAARTRLAAQWPMAAKRARADVIIDNSGGLETWAQQVATALAMPQAPTLTGEPLPDASPSVHGAPPIA
ncbi:MAG: dephospho-CoA kinase [Cyanobacteria bacterium K_Offshore_surface_m2_239]|nr:dephospho-CoA kinase [Cyanobacteria bacterium K_Offshore_surface_m2_239]